MKLFLVLLSVLSLFSSLALAAFSDDFDDDSFGIGGIGGIGGSGLDSFGGDNFFDDNKGWKQIKGKKGDGNGKYYVKSWSQVQTKGYPQLKKEKKILNDQKKWKGDRKVNDGAEKKKEVEGKKGGKEEPFGKNFDNFVGLD
ncbi:hypothetical protein JCM3765_007003 [Sporobolomyces pararoseus]